MYSLLHVEFFWVFNTDFTTLSISVRHVLKEPGDVWRHVLAKHFVDMKHWVSHKQLNRKDKSFNAAFV